MAIRLIGLDPGLRRTGWGVIEVEGNSLAHVASGAVTSTASLPLSERLFQLFDALTGILDLHAPAEAFPRHLAALHRALKPGGCLHIAMKLGRGAVRDRLGRHYSYFSQPELTDHLARAGFVIEDETTGEARGLAGDVEPWIALRARQQPV